MPQGPGPQFGSNPDASPVDETEAVQEAMDEESAELSAEGDDGVIDISEAEGPDVSGGDDVG
ncbi:hypothetical protein CLV52_1024 [Amnibacterium kyonggiense]|uniref:Uncharacterized protein n=2 Tax=Amnibacterium kyonggiense TaxID=595671 RepID=A0A4R7FS13_9MICO|nr:hypothetical protein CLV52_1024 [Amnibacterium kyonggiense]